MKWLLKEPSYGDMIRVKHGSIYHHGIYVSDDEVIQFGLSPIARPGMKDCDVEVCTSDITLFLSGGFLEVGEPEKSEKKKFRSPDEIVSIARNRLGEKNYSILYNNCEHFSFECATGEHKSSQTDTVRELFKNFPIADVYVAAIPENLEPCRVFPHERNKEIMACSHPRVRLEKYAAWKLLEYAMHRTLGLKLAEVDLTRAETGKWICTQCEFSISHGDGAVAVALSRKPIGVDIQLLAPIRDPHRMAERILSDTEFAEFQTIFPDRQNDYLIEKWTEKESIFKTLNASSFWGADPRSFSAKTNTRHVLFGEKSYALSVASEQIERLRYYEVDLASISK